jgi:polyisoprenoid-binding protein YceI
MNRRDFAVVLGGLLMTGVAGSIAFAQPSTWTIDKDHTQVNFQIRHLGVSNVRGSISGVMGTLTWNDKDPSQSEVTATIDTTTVSTNNEGRDKHLKSPDFFNTEKFSTMTFKSTSVTGASGKLKLVGDLTLAGVTKPISLDVDGPSAPIKGQGGTLVTGFSATGTLHRSDFNFGSKFSAPVLGDDVIFTIDVEAKQQ